MTPAEARAFNAGVAAVFDLARTASTALNTVAADRQSRLDPMREALGALAEQGEALLLPVGCSRAAAKEPDHSDFECR